MRLALTILILALAATAQTQAPTVYRLNPEASAAYMKINEAKSELVKQFQALDAQQTALMMGAGVPVEMRRNCAPDKDSIVVCSKPQASPEKK